MLEPGLIALLMQKTYEGDEPYDAFKHEVWPEDDPKHPMHLMHITEKTYNQIGMSLLSDATACELLAFTFEFGPECCVLDKKLNYCIRLAQKKLNIYGGEIPNAKLLGLLQEKLRDVCGFHAGFISPGQTYSPYVTHGVYPDWLNTLGERYAFKLPTPRPLEAEKKPTPAPARGKIKFKGGKITRS